MGTAATESGNTYEQVVRAWRLAELVVDSMFEIARSHRAVVFQDRRQRPWDDIVEYWDGRPGARAWQVRNRTSGTRACELGELLRGLSELEDDVVGCLGVGAAPAARGAPRLEVLLALTNASRGCGGKLRNFALVDGSEQECLAHVARLLGASAEAAFLLLRRLEVHFLGGKVAVRQQGVRCLANMYRDPESVFDSLVAFIVEQGATGARVRPDVVVDYLSRHARRSSRIVRALRESSDELLYWERDGRGVARTYWLRQDGDDVVEWGNVAGLLLGAPSRVWEFKAERVRVPILQCDPFDDFDFAKPPVSLDWVSSAVLRELSSGAVIPLGDVEEYGKDRWEVHIEQLVEARCSLATMASFKTHVHGDSGGAHPWHQVTIKTIHLDTGLDQEVWTEEEGRLVVAKYGRQAIAEQVHLQAGGDLELDSVELRQWTLSYDAGARARSVLQFTVEVCGADGDGSWDRYTASASIEVDWLPAAVSLNRNAPAMLAARWVETPRPPAGQYGWTQVPTEPRARRALELVMGLHRGDSTG